MISKQDFPSVSIGKFKNFIQTKYFRNLTEFDKYLHNFIRVSKINIFCVFSQSCLIALRGSDVLLILPWVSNYSPPRVCWTGKTAGGGLKIAVLL